MDILQQDRRESAEQRQDLCDIITRLKEDLQSTEEQRDKVGILQKSFWYGICVSAKIAWCGVLLKVDVCVCLFATL